MKYKNKVDGRLKDRLIKTTDGIVSANKMKKPRSSLRSASHNIGNIVHKKSGYDKAMEKVALKNGDYTDGVEVKQKESTNKPFNKGGVSYINYNGKGAVCTRGQKVGVRPPRHGDGRSGNRLQRHRSGDNDIRGNRIRNGALLGADPEEPIPLRGGPCRTANDEFPGGGFYVADNDDSPPA